MNRQHPVFFLVASALLTSPAFAADPLAIGPTEVVLDDRAFSEGAEVARVVAAHRGDVEACFLAHYAPAEVVVAVRLPTLELEVEQGAGAGECIAAAALEWTWPDALEETTVTLSVTATEATTPAVPELDVPGPKVGAPDHALPFAVVKRVVRSHRDALGACYPDAPSALTGLLELEFTIGADGGVIAVAFDGEPPGETELEECLAGVLRAMRFPEPKGGGIVRVRYPATLMPAP